MEIPDKVCPTFGLFSWHEQKLMKFSWYSTTFPSHFNNIYLKSFRLSQNLTRNYKILQILTKFHETNKTSWIFLGIRLCFCSFEMYFVDFCFCFRCFRKLSAKFLFCSDLLKIFKVSNLAMAKVKKSSYLQQSVTKFRIVTFAFRSLFVVPHKSIFNVE